MGGFFNQRCGVGFGAIHTVLGVRRKSQLQGRLGLQRATHCELHGLATVVQELYFYTPTSVHLYNLLIHSLSGWSSVLLTFSSILCGFCEIPAHFLNTRIHWPSLRCLPWNKLHPLYKDHSWRTVLCRCVVTSCKIIRVLSSSRSHCSSNCMKSAPEVF